MDDDLASAFRNRREQQLGIAGIAREYATIEKAAEALREVERQCKAAAELKADMADKLLFALIEEGVKKYTDSEGKRFTVRAKTKTSVEVKRGWEEEE